MKEDTVSRFGEFVFHVLIIGAVGGKSIQGGTVPCLSHSHGIVSETIPTLRIGFRPVDQHEAQVMIRGAVIQLY